MTDTIEIGTSTSWAFINSQLDLPESRRRKVHIIEGEKTLCGLRAGGSWETDDVTMSECMSLLPLCQRCRRGKLCRWIITKIPLNELTDDLYASIMDVKLCEWAIVHGHTEYGDGKSMQFRLDGNQDIIEKIDAELERRAPQGNALPPPSRRRT